MPKKYQNTLKTACKSDEMLRPMVAPTDINVRTSFAVIWLTVIL